MDLDAAKPGKADHFAGGDVRLADGRVGLEEGDVSAVVNYRVSQSR